jgi:hypothetical protein
LLVVLACAAAPLAAQQAPKRWRPDDERPEVISEALQWAPLGTMPPVRLEVPALFATVLGPL